MQCSTEERKRQYQGGDEDKKTRRKRYVEARKMTERIAGIMAMNQQKRIAERMQQCGERLDGGICPQCRKWYSVSMDRACGHRLCPLCAMRRSRVIVAQSLAAVDYVAANEARPYSLHMVTLTQRNVARGELNNEVDALLETVEHLRHRRSMRNGVIGSARTIEITCNPGERKQLVWHPHVHMIIMLHGQPELATKAGWDALWRDLRGLNYKPQIDVHHIMGTDAVYEVSKYVTKFGRLLDGLTDRQAAPLVDELERAVYKRRLMAWTGVWREAKRKLNQQDVERMKSEELDEVAQGCPDCGTDLMHAIMRWNGMDYLERMSGKKWQSKKR